MGDRIDLDALEAAAGEATEGEWWDGRVHDPDGRSREVRANKPTLDPRPDDLAAVRQYPIDLRRWLADPARSADELRRVALALLDDRTTAEERLALLADPAPQRVELRRALTARLPESLLYDLTEAASSIVPTPCSHGIYNHGCPSCDQRDPEDRE